ncbi:MAG: OmpH family outer membrane protein [Bacteroidota bacterium]|nr:OmpH family outer membrane protein [Bacteroidota bacterium]
MRNTLKAIIVCLIVVLPVSSFAQKTSKFGHVNYQEVFQLLPDMDSAQLKSQKYIKDLEGSLETMQVEYNNKLQKYTEEKDKLSNLVKKDREDELVQMQQRIEAFKENAQSDIRQKNDALMQPILEKINKAITEVGKDGGYIYIFDISAGSTPIRYFSAESQDVTDAVKQKLNIKPGAKVSAPKAAAPAAKR